MEGSWGLVSITLKMVNQCLQYPAHYHHDSFGFQVPIGWQSDYLLGAQDLPNLAPD